MSNWLSKSEVSLKIASDKNGFLNNRVHCYYYGCVQYMFHLLHIELKMTEKEISDNCNPNINKGNGGTHTWLAKYFFEDLKKQTYILDGLEISNKMGLLKRLRTEADYGLNDVNIEKLTNASELSTKITSILSKRYTL
jgi:hypothetical protein